MKTRGAAQKSTLTKVILIIEKLEVIKIHLREKEEPKYLRGRGVEGISML